ncbi:uncharacterized protein LOC102899949 isoform X2 [Felis catus]|uniref:uncharacterized protein LOC102899949 isoform X2 n=1 Tax=Felis catus TaxID=9685 RepID=UPI0009487144|nr:uncharacterized protein LOC102899949 isoform X2 [Felis catus]
MRNRAGLGVRKSRRKRRVGAGLVEGRVLPRPLGWPDTEQLGAGAGAGASASAPAAAGGGGACGSEGGGSGAAGFLPLHYPWPTASLCRCGGWTRGCVTAESCRSGACPADQGAARHGIQLPNQRFCRGSHLIKPSFPSSTCGSETTGPEAHGAHRVSWVRGGRLPDLAEKGGDSWRCGRRGPLQR